MLLQGSRRANFPWMEQRDPWLCSTFSCWRTFECPHKGFLLSVFFFCSQTTEKYFNRQGTVTVKSQLICMSTCTAVTCQQEVVWWTPTPEQLRLPWLFCIWWHLVTKEFGGLVPRLTHLFTVQRPKDSAGTTRKESKKKVSFRLLDFLAFVHFLTTVFQRNEDRGGLDWKALVSRDSSRKEEIQPQAPTQRGRRKNNNHCCPSDRSK